MAAGKRKKQASTAASVIVDDARDASLRVSGELRNALKAASAIQGMALYDLCNQIIGDYLKTSGFQTLVQQARRKLPAT